MTSIINKISSFFKPTESVKTGEELLDKHESYQSLLIAYDKALEKMATLSEMLSQKEPFAFGKGRRIILEILEYTENVIQNIKQMSNPQFEVLSRKLDQINSKENSVLSLAGKIDKDSLSLSDTPYYLELQDINVQHISKVGGKMARLGEVKNVLDIPVPEGICITARCFEEFFTINNLRGKINEFASSLDINNSIELQEASRAIQAMLVSAPIPENIENEILQAYDKLCRRVRDECLVAVRSSAVGEDDSRHSFAGLHYTALNVSRQNLVDACWEVLISKYLPESMVYRFITGLRDIDMPMNIGCMTMMDSAISGTLYTVDPQKKKTGLIIQAIQGVGSLLVEGKVAPQEYVVDRRNKAKVLEFLPGDQKYFLKPRNGDGLDHVEFDPGKLNERLLTQKQIESLTKHALTIEKHFSIPQDIEWTCTQDGKIYILQTRPLQVVDFEKAQTDKKYSLDEIKTQYPSFFEGGDCACQGVGSGPVFIATQERFLVDFPDGGVLVAKRTSPAYARVLHKAAAVVTEVGSTTGHLSIIARELGVPTILNLGDVTNTLKNGGIVTVDAFHGVVFPGKVEEIISGVFKDTDTIAPFHNTPIFNMIKQASEYILPLNLLDSQLESFTPQDCQTAHDIIRFCHEIAVLDILNINNFQYGDFDDLRKMDSSIPLDIYVSDLAGGLLSSHGDFVKLTDIKSKPFKVLIKELEILGFNETENSRKLDKSCHTFISSNFLNFFAQFVNYNFNLDIFISPSTHCNYISCRFKNGVADLTRTKKTDFVTQILNHYGFTIKQSDDYVFSIKRKIEENEMLDLVRILGRLLSVIHSTDFAICSDEEINMKAETFLTGNQQLEKNNSKGD